MKNSTLFVCMMVLLVGCLKTRAELRQDLEDQTPQVQTVAQQKAEARANNNAKPAPPPTTASRFEEYDEQMRQLNGRMDVIDNAITQAGNRHQEALEKDTKDRAAIDQKFVAYEEALKKLEAQVASLSEEVAHLKAPPPPPEKPAAQEKPAAKESSAVKGRKSYDDGESLLASKKFKEAIVAYQKYRDSYPKGQVYGDATYKIGVCFQELGLKDEAKTFFEEVTTKFPNSKEAKKAAVRMKSLK